MGRKPKASPCLTARTTRLAFSWTRIRTIRSRSVIRGAMRRTSRKTWKMRSTTITNWCRESDAPLHHPLFQRRDFPTALHQYCDLQPEVAGLAVRSGGDVRPEGAPEETVRFSTFMREHRPTA